MNNIIIKQIQHQDIMNMTNDKFQDLVNIIFNNFFYLMTNNQILHNMTEITRILKSTNIVMFCLYHKHDDINKLIGYCISETMTLSDKRDVVHVHYLFVSKHYRNNKYGSCLLNCIVRYAKEMFYHTVITTIDTNNEKLMKFFETKGWTYDLIQRKYQQYDVLSLVLY